jgi:hypothetical protein
MSVLQRTTSLQKRDLYHNGSLQIAGELKASNVYTKSETDTLIATARPPVSLNLQDGTTLDVSGLATASQVSTLAATVNALKIPEAYDVATYDPTADPKQYLTFNDMEIMLLNQQNIAASIPTVPYIIDPTSAIASTVDDQRSYLATKGAISDWISINPSVTEYGFGYVRPQQKLFARSVTETTDPNFKWIKTGVNDATSGFDSLSDNRLATMCCTANYIRSELNVRDRTIVANEIRIAGLGTIKLNDPGEQMLGYDATYNPTGYLQISDLPTVPTAYNSASNTNGYLTINDIRNQNIERVIMESMSIPYKVKGLEDHKFETFAPSVLISSTEMLGPMLGLTVDNVPTYEVTDAAGVTTVLPMIPTVTGSDGNPTLDPNYYIYEFMTRNSEDEVTTEAMLARTNDWAQIPRGHPVVVLSTTMFTTISSDGSISHAFNPRIYEFMISNIRVGDKHSPLKFWEWTRTPILGSGVALRMIANHIDPDILDELRMPDSVFLDIAPMRFYQQFGDHGYALYPVNLDAPKSNRESKKTTFTSIGNQLHMLSSATKVALDQIAAIPADVVSQLSALNAMPVLTGSTAINMNALLADVRSISDAITALHLRVAGLELQTGVPTLSSEIALSQITLTEPALIALTTTLHTTP